MSTTVSQLLAALATRIRDPYLMSLATASPPDPPTGSPFYSPSGAAFACVVLSEAQQAVNMLERNVVAKLTYTLPARTSYIQISTDGTLGSVIVRPIGIKLETGYDLVPMPFAALQQSDFYWFNRVASTPRSWAMVGTDAFVVYPQARRNLTVTVVGPAYLSTLLPPGPPQSIQLDDSLVHKLLDVAEAMCYLKTRNLDFYQTTFQRLQQHWPTLKLGATQEATSEQG